MNTVICADLHLDGDFALFRKNPEKAALRRQDTQDTFRRILDTVRETKADLLLIAGDLWENNHVTAETVRLVQEAFASVPETYIFIAPGNNDPATPISPYCTEKWPENVYIFTHGLEAVELHLPKSEEKVRVYGAGFQGSFTRSSFLNPEQLPLADPGYINILLMHASLREHSSCNPISADDLNRCGFDFCALGHEHRFSGIIATGNTFYAYPGACEERSFAAAQNDGAVPVSAQAQGGILVGTIAHQYQDLHFRDITTRHHVTAELDISGMTTAEQIQSAIRANFPANQNLYRITLTGIPDKALRFSLKELSRNLEKDYFYIRLATRFEADCSDSAPIRSGQLRDYFRSEVLLQRTLGSADPELLRLAALYGLAALDGPEALETVMDREEVPEDEN